MGLLLALDSSTEELCVAVINGGDVAAAGQERGGAVSSQRLLPMALELLGRAGLNWEGLQGVAVAVGPGAFTGLRSACSAAQGLALGLQLPVVPLDSLEIVAQEARDSSGPASADGALVLGVAVDARMGQVYDACYEWRRDALERVAAPVVRSPDETAVHWLSGRPAPKVWVGSGVPLMAKDLLIQAQQAGVQWVRVQSFGRAGNAQSLERARALGRCAARAWSKGLRLDPAQLQPYYVRDRVAQTTREREAAARGEAGNG